MNAHEYWVHYGNFIYMLTSTNTIYGQKFLPSGHQVYRPHLFTLTPGSWMREQHNKNRYFSYNTCSVKSILYYLPGNVTFFTIFAAIYLQSFEAHRISIGYSIK